MYRVVFFLIGGKKKWQLLTSSDTVRFYLSLLLSYRENILNKKLKKLWKESCNSEKKFSLIVTHPSREIQKLYTYSSFLLFKETKKKGADKQMLWLSPGNKCFWCWMTFLTRVTMPSPSKRSKLNQIKADSRQLLGILYSSIIFVFPGYLGCWMQHIAVVKACPWRPWLVKRIIGASIIDDWPLPGMIDGSRNHHQHHQDREREIV